MKTVLAILAVVALANLLPAAPLTESTFTEIIREASTVDTSGAATPAKVDALLKAPNRVRTGPQSRVELTAADKSITRIGANTIFSFSDSGRTLNLDQGSLLFHAPKGIGGGTIKSGGASAAVLGTTLIASATKDGGFRVVVLEGKAQIKLANGKSVTLTAGQEVLVTPDGNYNVVEINLAKLVAGSLLVNGFLHELPSLALVKAAIQQQQTDIATGKAKDENTFASPHNYTSFWSPGLLNVAVPPASAQPVVTTTYISGPPVPFITLFGSVGIGPSVPLYNGPAAAYQGPTTYGAPAYFGTSNPYTVGAEANGTAQATAPNASLAPVTINNPSVAPANTVFPNLEIAYPNATVTPVTTTTYPSPPPRNLILLP
jgi:hypothetical protein